MRIRAKDEKKSKKEKVLTIVNPRGVMTRKEVCIYVGVTRGYLCNLNKRGELVPDVQSMLGTEGFYTKRNVDRWRKSLRKYEKGNKRRSS